MGERGKARGKGIELRGQGTDSLTFVGMGEKQCRSEHIHPLTIPHSGIMPETLSIFLHPI